MEFRINKKVLFEGVFLEDLQKIEDIFEDKLTEGIDTCNIDTATEADGFDDLRNMMLYDDDIPCKFVSENEWITNTNINCWNCTLSIMKRPVFIPEKLVQDGTMETYGLFCSWNCAAKYIERNYQPYRKIELMANLRIAYKRMHGYAPSGKIVPAPGHEKLIQYCGTNGLTEMQFREKLQHFGPEKIRDT